MSIDRLKPVREKLKKWENPVFLVSGRENIRFLSGFTGSSGQLLISSESAWLLSDFRYRTQAAEELFPGIVFVEGPRFPDKLKELLSEIRPVNLLFESCHSSYADFQKLETVLRELDGVSITLQGQEALVEQIRLSKSEEELAFIKKAVKIAEEAFKEVFPLIRPGARESEIALSLEYEIKKRGGKPAFDTIVASGINGAKPHAGATYKKLVAGDLVVIDWGARYKGYCSDMSRTISLGRPAGKGKEIFQTVLSAQARAIKAVRPGIACAEVDGGARNYIKDRGYGEFFGHGTGHGVGLEIHEQPTVSSQSKTSLEQGMVFTVEPGIYLPDYGGVRIEDMVAVTAEGCQTLTSLPREIVVNIS
ncbi:MAG: aminopeptidase P family protein [bacterium]